MPLAVGIPVDLAPPPEPQSYLFETVAGAALNINLSAATAVAGYVIYSQE
jgi:hypothetical protein